MNKFINTNAGLIFVLLVLICAAGVEQMTADKYMEQKHECSTR